MARTKRIQNPRLGEYRKMWDSVRGAAGNLVCQMASYRNEECGRLAEKYRTCANTIKCLLAE
ncbi:MAG: hypothetical protein ACLUKN_08860 [Bacilli bacterium]